MISGQKLKLSGQGIIISENREWLDDNMKVVYQGGEFYEVVDISDENQVSRFGWFIQGDLHITSDFTLHTKNGMRGESFNDDLKQVLIIDQNSKLDEFVSGELVDLDISEAQITFDNLLASNFNFDFGSRFKNIQNQNDHGVIFLSQNPEKILIQTNSTSVNIGGKGIFVLDREEDSLILMSEREGITVIKDGEHMIEINGDTGISIDGFKFDPMSIVSHIKESISDAFSDFDF